MTDRTDTVVVPREPTWAMIDAADALDREAAQALAASAGEEG